jgi:hypothetical protein
VARQSKPSSAHWSIKGIEVNHVKSGRKIDLQAAMIQGDSVRMTWGVDDPDDIERKPLRRGMPDRIVELRPTKADTPPASLLQLRLGEELDFARRMLDATGEEITADPIALSGHAVALQALDKVSQMLAHIANVIRSDDPAAAVGNIRMGELKARLQRSGSL